MPADIPYTGPSVKDMIANHSLAENIIKHHHSNSGDNEIFDAQEMQRLRRFVRDPERERSAIISELGIEDHTGTTEFHGSLAGYVVLRHGNNDVLTADEIETLKGWFTEQESTGRNVAMDAQSWQYVC
jgi:hypothetical protein